MNFLDTQVKAVEDEVPPSKDFFKSDVILMMVFGFLDYGTLGM